MAQLVKNPPAIWETWVLSLGWEDPLEKGGLPTPVFWPGEFHGGIVHGVKESDTTEQLSLNTSQKFLPLKPTLNVHKVLSWSTSQNTNCLCSRINRYRKMKQ